MQKSEDEHPIKKAVTNADKKKKQVVERDEDDEDEDVSDEEEKEEIVDKQEDDPKKNDFEQTYIFSLLWAVGGYLENAERWKEKYRNNLENSNHQGEAGDTSEGPVTSAAAQDRQGRLPVQLQCQPPQAKYLSFVIVFTKRKMIDSKKITSAIVSYTAESGVTGTSISQTMSSLTSTPSPMAGRVCHIYILYKVTCL